MKEANASRASDDPMQRGPTAAGASAFGETFTWSDSASGFPVDPATQRRNIVSAHGLAVFDDTMHTTNTWLKELMEQLHYESRQDAYRALRETLHALRDHLPAETVVSLAAQLPLLIRGVYYEGWRLNGAQEADRSEEHFVGLIAPHFHQTKGQRDPREIIAAVFALLETKVSAGEIAQVKNCLPAKIRALWR